MSRPAKKTDSADRPLRLIPMLSREEAAQMTHIDQMALRIQRAAELTEMALLAEAKESKARKKT